MKESASASKTVVIKIGSSFLFGNERSPQRSLESFSGVVRQVAAIRRQGARAVIVSSGAIAFGMQCLRLQDRPKEISGLQAAAAVGQHLLMRQFGELFESEGLHCAQILLTWDDFRQRTRYLNAKNTLKTLLSIDSVPIVNENDTVSTDEIRFGDNDRLSALVASMISADLLIILSDVDGLLDRDKALVRRVDALTPSIRRLAQPTLRKKVCVGGMMTKLDAASIAVESGIACVIAHGRRPGIITSLVADPACAGTLFVPKTSLRERQRWIAFSSKPRARIVVDAGAQAAIARRKSLLPVGIVRVEGSFAAGDIVEIVSSEGQVFARGKTTASSALTDARKGKRSEREIVHSNDMVLLQGA